VSLSPATGVDVELTTDDGGGGGYDIGRTSPAAQAGLLRTDQADNVASYLLGTPIPGGGGLQAPGPTGGLDGDKPGLADYQAAFARIAREVNIFNMLVLPRANGQSDSDRQSIWGAASSFAAEQRAILFVDPGADWNDIAAAVAGADSAKVGVDTRTSVIYWPKLKVAAPDAPKGRIVDPSGSMAGLYARTDTRFGTWRAPAGIEATLTGVLGTTVPMSDPHNGQINPLALNAIRQFPSGITAWGARMMVGADDTGNVDDKYVNVRRMMLFIENSLYRALRFAVFKNNAEPLWASIRLAAGSFMNGLMTQGAFASDTKSDAYFVQCDSSTTTPTDVNLGIVNVVVGFAPNKPAEFVHLTVTQMAGQVEV
jgi:phage tail sheath protein FI